MKTGPQLEALATREPEIRLRRVDVVSWDSAVATRYSIRSLPTLWLYHDGRRVADNAAATMQKLASAR